MDDLRAAVVRLRTCGIVAPVLLALLVGAGCDRVDARLTNPRTSPATGRAAADPLARARQDSINRAQPGYIVDSILPIEEALRRFRAAPGPVPTTLSGGAGSREALVRSFIRTLETRDTAALQSLALTPAEFGWLVYPTSPFVAPPYRQAPELVWMQISLASGSGQARLLARLAGRPLGYAGHGCGSEPERQGENRLWRRCVVRLTQTGGTSRAVRLFGDIIERRGHFKFVSLANDF